MRLNYRGEPFALATFRTELKEMGAEFLEPTNEWEVLRYRYGGKVGVIYRNKKWQITATGPAGAHVACFAAGRPLNMGSKEAKKLRPAIALQLYTDASSYHTTGAASWGAVLVDADGVEHEASGPLKGEVSSSTAAEARAVANALHHFIKAGLITGDVRVVCDNQAVVNKLRAQCTKSKSQQVREALLHIRKITRGRCNVFSEWVKGHQSEKAGKTNPHVRLNCRCDALAKAHSVALHTERKAAAWERADAVRAEIREAAIS